MNLDTLNNISHQVSTKIPYLKMLILFGSRARGDTHSNSDWDFAVFYDQSLREKNVKGFGWFEIYEILADIFHIPDDRIDVVDLDHCSPLIAHYIAQDGQLLYEREQELFNEFQQKSLMSEMQLKEIQTNLRQKLEKSLQARGV